MSSSMLHLLAMGCCCILIIQLPTVAGHVLESSRKYVHVVIVTADAEDQNLRTLGEKLKPGHLIPLSLIVLGEFAAAFESRGYIPFCPDPYIVRPIELDRHDSRTYILHAGTQVKRELSWSDAIKVFHEEVLYMSGMPQCRDAESTVISLTDKDILCVMETLVAKLKEAYATEVDASNEMNYIFRPLPKTFDLIIPRDLDGGPKASPHTPGDKNHVRIAPFVHKLQEYVPRENSPIQMFYHMQEVILTKTH